MTKEEIFDRIKTIMLRNDRVNDISIDESKIVMGANLIHDIGLDSLDVVELEMTIEDEFDIEDITDEEWESTEYTMAGFVDLIAKHD